MWFSILLLKYTTLYLKNILSGWEHMLYKSLSIDDAFPDMPKCATDLA